MKTTGRRSGRNQPQASSSSGLTPGPDGKMILQGHWIAAMRILNQKTIIMVRKVILKFN